ncbi:DUF397 domain-containing protein [Saccharothrix sp. AJ9571]|nr:DUF397 domain-containing protein [Saccharothrix sp. AJ9571]
MDDKAHIRHQLDLSAAQWRQAGPEGEVAFVPHTDGVTYIALREAGGDKVLVFTPSEWTAFRAGVHDAEFERPADL